MTTAVSRWAERVGLGRKTTVVLAVAAALSGLATYAALSGEPPFSASSSVVLLLLLLNLILLLLLGALVAKRLVEVWTERRRGLAGAQLHVRLVVLFSLVSVVPTIVVASFSFLFFSLGIQAWFSERVHDAVSSSLAVAEAYLHEHQNTIRADVQAMAADLNRGAPVLLFNPQALAQVLTAQSAFRSLSEAVILDTNGRIVARSGLSFALEFEPVPEWAIQQARAGDVAVVTSDTDERVRALIRLDQFGDAFLYVGRFVDPQVIGYMERTQSAVDQYEEMEGKRSGFQIRFALVFIVVALLFLVAAVWVGMTFATRLVRPIGALVTAAERVRAGDLSARAGATDEDGEFGTLARAFNRMTSQLQAQQGELIEANRQLDQRRRFTETVLAGVSAGVIGVDAERRINLPNRSASVLLGLDLDHSVGEPLAQAVPEMAALLAEVAARPDRLAQAQLTLQRRGRTQILLVRVAADREEGLARGYIVTFDDVTELVSAQRKAAWADVARRIAHEIKNPLTPIQLSAERLKRKYLREISSDPDTFAICTDTIVRHVGDIGRMVDEFSSFARMPAPVMKTENVAELIRQAVFLQKNAHPAIRFEIVESDEPPVITCDAHQVSQALTNLLKNAAESVEGRSGADLPKGEVRVLVEPGPAILAITVEDNGKGLPATGRERLTEPYVTTRAKGTGLGLAIVKKIMEDQGGELVLDDREGGGARISLIFARAAAPDAAPAAQPREKAIV